jgi:Ricin-type beta-trefoil lectin domain-like
VSGKRGIRALAAAFTLMLAAAGLVASLPIGPAVADPPQALGLPPGPRYTVPEVVSNLDGRREVFVRGHKDEVYHARELCAGCGQWSPWDSMGANIWGHPVAARQADGRIVVVMWARDNRVYYAKQRNPGSLEWDGWTQVSDQSMDSVPALAINADGRLELFATLRWNSVPPKDWRVYHAWQVAPNGSWSSWAPMGGDFPQITATSPEPSEPIAAARNADGQLEIVATGASPTVLNQLYSTRQSSFGAWTYLGGSNADGQPHFFRRPFLVRGPDNRLHLFMLIHLHNFGSPGQQVAHLWQTSPGGAWSAPALMPGTERFESVDYVTTNADGRIEIGASDGNRVARRTVQVGSSNDFGPWQTDAIGYGPASTAETAEVSSGRYTLTSMYSGKCLEVAGSSTSDGAVVRQQACADAPRQQWLINPHPDGGYTLAAVHSGKCLEIAGSSTADGAAAQQRVCTGAKNQEWRFDRTADGTYAIVPRHSEKCLDATPSTADGAATVQWGCVVGSQQHFRLTPAGPYMLVADHSGKCLDVLGASIADGATVDQWTCIDVDNLRFRPRIQPDGSVALVAVHSGKCLEVAGASTADGAVVQQRTCTGVAHQRFATGLLLDGTAYFAALHSGKCLNVAGASQGTGALVTQQTCTTGANEHWRLVPAGTYTIVAVHSGKCAEVAGASTADGAAIQQRTCADVAHQRWRLAAGSDPGSVMLIATHSGKCLDATSTEGNAVPAMQWPCHAGPSQRWLPGPLDNGNGFLVEANLKRCLDVNGAAVADGTTIDSWGCVPGATNEYWRLKPLPNS